MLTREEALALRAKYGTWAEAARREKIPQSTLKTAAQRVTPDVVRQLDMPADAATIPIIADKRLLRLEDENKLLRKKLKEATRDSIEADEIRRMAFAIGESDPLPPAWLRGKDSTAGSPGVPVTIWSDWHWDEVVKKHEVGGLNEFNRAIAKERVARLVERTLDICFRHQTKATYPGIVVGLLGDMFGGAIHEELAETNEGTILESILDISGVIEWALVEVAKEFEHVTLPCVVGNHDRMTEHVRFKTRATTSYSWLLYNLLEKRLAEKYPGKFSFLISPHTSVTLDIQGWRHGFTHGDSLGVSGGDGQIGALGPILRGGLRFMKQYRDVGEIIDVLCMGHWHDYIPLGQRGVVVNGTLKGYCDYAFGRRFAPAPPSQALWFVHPRHGITQQWPVYLTEDGSGRVRA